MKHVMWLEEMARLGMPFDSLFQLLSDPSMGPKDHLLAVSMMRKLIDKGKLCTGGMAPEEVRAMLRNHARNCFLKMASTIAPIRVKSQPEEELAWVKWEREEPGDKLPAGAFDYTCDSSSEDDLQDPNENDQ